MIFIGTSRIIEGQCGIGTLKYFRDFHFKTREEAASYAARNFAGRTFAVDTTIPKNKENKIAHQGGTGLFGTGFIDTNLMKEVYVWLCANYKMVSITPVRINENSDNRFFYAMFDDEEHNDVKYITPPPWPFGE